MGAADAGWEAGLWLGGAALAGWGMVGEGLETECGVFDDGWGALLWL